MINIDVRIKVEISERNTTGAKNITQHIKTLQKYKLGI